MQVARAALPVLTSIVALALTLALPPVRAGSPFLLFMAAVMVSSWFGGLWPGLAAATLGSGAIVAFILPPAFDPWQDGGRIATFLVVALVITGLNVARQRAERARADEEASRRRSDAAAAEFRRLQAMTDAALARAESSEQHYRSLVEALPQIVWTARADGAVDFYNQRWLDYVGLAPGDGRAADWARIIHPDDLAHLRACIAHALARGETWELEFRLRRGVDGGYRWHLGRGVPERDAAGRVVRWVGTCTDVDDQKRAEEERARAERLKDDLAGMVVHDLKNPVFGIVMLVQAAMRRGEELPERQRHYLRQIERTCRGMMRLIQNLLEISKIEQGKMPVTAEPVVLAELVDEVAAEYGPVAAETGRALTIAFGADLPPTVADRGLLKRVLVNLVVNALRHSGSREVRLEGSPGPAAGDVTIRVVDHGRGIPPEELARLFDKFRGTRRSAADDPSGDTGLGLPFCKLAVERMGGEIRAESSRETGTVFTVRLPAGSVPSGPS
jgi:hypothetical protein